ncbi:MAG: hypothetical protein HQL69_02220 [Magnetococcales bacterium]|nr:hypothetical protein [Magnetococcales bacterium]
MVLFDTSILIFLTQPYAKVLNDPVTGEPVSNPGERVDYLIKRLNKSKERIIIPTPALTEYLVKAGEAMQEQLKVFEKPPFQIVPFDTRAAIECAFALNQNKFKNKKEKEEAVSRAKIKFDWQIVSIAIVEKVSAIYSDDLQIKRFAEKYDISVISIASLDLDPGKDQLELVL